jgi:hypothetical protein
LTLTARLKCRYRIDGQIHQQMRQRPIKIKHRVTTSRRQQKGRDEARRDRNLTVVKSDLGRKRITNLGGHNTRRYLVTKHRCHT